MAFTSFSSHLFQAFYNWMVENDLTPHLRVDANKPGVEVPSDYVRAGQIVLSVAPAAVRNLDIGPDAITFDARFKGEDFSVCVPYSAMYDLMAVETGVVYPLMLWFADFDNMNDPQSEDSMPQSEEQSSQASQAEVEKWLSELNKMSASADKESEAPAAEPNKESSESKPAAEGMPAFSIVKD